MEVVLCICQITLLTELITLTIIIGYRKYFHSKHYYFHVKLFIGSQIINFQTIVIGSMMEKLVNAVAHRYHTMGILFNKDQKGCHFFKFIASILRELVNDDFI